MLGGKITPKQQAIADALNEAERGRRDAGVTEVSAVGWGALVTTLDELWPWAKVEAVRAALASWAHDYYTPLPARDLAWRIDRVPHSDPLADVAPRRAHQVLDQPALQDVAEHLARIGNPRRGAPAGRRDLGEEPVPRDGRMDALRAMANQDVSPHERDIARAKLQATGLPPTPARRTDPQRIGVRRVASITLLMVRNVAAGRDVLDYGYFEHFGGRDSTIKRYRKGDPEAWWSKIRSETPEPWWSKLQWDIDIDIMVRGGWKPDSARVWLKRHSGKHANDAGSPRPSTS